MKLQEDKDKYQAAAKVCSSKYLNIFELVVYLLVIYCYQLYKFYTQFQWF